MNAFAPLRKKSRIFYKFFLQGAFSFIHLHLQNNTRFFKTSFIQQLRVISSVGSAHPDTSGGSLLRSEHQESVLKNNLGD